MTATKRKPTEVLKAAAEIIRETGLAKELYHDSDRHCAIGAVRCASIGLPPGHTMTHADFTADIDQRALQVLKRRVAENDEQYASYSTTTVVGTFWNDRPETTAEDVIRVLEGGKRQPA